MSKTMTMTCPSGELIARDLINEPFRSKGTWKEAVGKVKRQCKGCPQGNGHGECQIEKCLDQALLLAWKLAQAQNADKKDVKVVYSKIYVDVYSKIYVLYSGEELRPCARENGCWGEELEKEIIDVVLAGLCLKIHLLAPPEKASLKTYLCKAVKNRCINYKKKEGRSGGSDGEEIISTDYPEPSYEEMPSYEEIIDILIDEFIGAFNTEENCFQLLKYFFIDGKSYEQILETEEGMQYSSVESLRNRMSICKNRVALQKLIERLGDKFLR